MIRSIASSIWRSIVRTSSLSNINALFLDALSQKGVHFVSDADDVHMAMEPPFNVLLDMDKGKRIGRLCRHVNVDVAVIANVTTGDRAKHTKRDDAIPIGISAFEVAQKRDDVVSIHPIAHILSQELSKA
jgi:hypothetical protein